MPTQVLSPRLHSDVADALRAIAENFFTRTRLVITADEFVAAFIQPDHAEKLVDVQAMVGRIGMHSGGTSLPVPDAPSGALRFSYAFSGEPPCLIPQYVANGLVPSCPERLLQRITEWTNERFRIGKAFGTLFDGIEYLNYRCTDIRAMAVMMPVLPALMAQTSLVEDSAVVKRAQRLSQNTKVPKLPKLLPVQREALRDASALVSMAIMVKDAPMPVVPGHHCSLMRGVNGAQCGPSLFEGRPAAFY
jgi:hypothetical protein